MCEITQHSFKSDCFCTKNKHQFLVFPPGVQSSLKVQVCTIQHYTYVQNDAITLFATLSSTFILLFFAVFDFLALQAQI